MGEYVSTTQGANGTIINTFYTCFERNGEHLTKISKDPVAGFWKFQTNLSWEDLTLFMDEIALRRFLFSMWDIYRFRET